MNRNKQLDGLRAIAVSLVLIEHFAVPVAKVFSAGYYGVDLFFVISGFLITTILVKSKESFGAAYAKFIGRRTLRIFPIYYLTIFLLFAINNEDIHKYLIYCVTYTFNYALVTRNIPMTSINHFWSLCVEEQFYLFWPFIVLGLRQSMKALKIVVLLLVLVCYAQIFFNIFPALKPFNTIGLIPRADSLGIGALGAILVLENRIPLKLLEDKRLEWLSIALLAFFLVFDFKLKFLVCPLVSLFLILKTTHKGFAIARIDKFLRKVWLINIGSISYGIYLYHQPLGHYITEYIFDPLFWNKIDWPALGPLSILQWNSWIIKLPLFGGLSILLAHVSFKYLESPILTLKDKWFGYRSGNRGEKAAPSDNIIITPSASLTPEN